MPILVGVGVLVRRGSWVLVGKRLNSAGAGTWSLPGGRVEYGESPLLTGVRELLEETGIDVTPLVSDAAAMPFSVKLDGFASHIPPPPSDYTAGAPFIGAQVTVLCVEEQAHMVVSLVIVDAPDGVQAKVTEPHKCESWHWVPWSDILALAATFAPPSTTTPALHPPCLSPEGEVLRGGKVFGPLLAVALSGWDPFAASAGDAIRLV